MLESFGLESIDYPSHRHTFRPEYTNRKRLSQKARGLYLGKESAKAKKQNINI